MMRLAICLFFVLISYGPVGAGDFSLHKVLTVQSLAKFSPHARADILEAFAQNKVLLESAGINSATRFYHLLSQLAVESGGFTTLSENMRYRPERLLKVFRKYVKTIDKARELAGRERATANFVYGGRQDLGNRGVNTNDGWNYRGSGFIQLTGRFNFIAVGDRLNLPLEETPDQVRTPLVGLKAALEFWTRNKINLIADKDDVKAVRKAVNGGKIGLLEAQVWFAKAKMTFGPALGLESAGGDELQEAIASLLQDKGFMKSSALESGADVEALSLGIKKFEEQNDLDVTEIPEGLESASDVPISDDLIYRITDPQNLVEKRELEQQK